MVHSDSIIPDDSIIIIIIIQRAWSLCARLKERWSTWLKWLHFPQHVRKKRYNFDRLGVSVVSLQLSGKRGRFLIATTLWIRARLRKSRYVHRREERARVEFHGQWYFHFVPASCAAEKLKFPRKCSARCEERVFREVRSWIWRMLFEFGVVGDRNWRRMVSLIDLLDDLL